MLTLSSASWRAKSQRALNSSGRIPHLHKFGQFSGATCCFLGATRHQGQLLQPEASEYQPGLYNLSVCQHTTSHCHQPPNSARSSGQLSQSTWRCYAMPTEEKRASRSWHRLEAPSISLQSQQWRGFTAAVVDSKPPRQAHESDMRQARSTNKFHGAVRLV